MVRKRGHSSIGLGTGGLGRRTPQNFEWGLEYLFWNYALLAHQIQRFQARGCCPPFQPPENLHFDGKTEIIACICGFPIFYLWKGVLSPGDSTKNQVILFVVPPDTHFLMKRRAAPLQLSKMTYFFYELRVKGAWNYVYLVHQIQNFLRQGLKIIVHLWSLKYTYSLYEEEGCPLNYDHQECYIQFRLKGAWNYEYLAHQIQHFLWHGCAAPRPLATIEYVHIHIDQKKKEMKLCIWSSPIHFYFS